MTRSLRGLQGAKKKQRKPRNWKQRGGLSYDWCPYCFRPYCDPLGLSPHIEKKIDKRIDEGLCPACGHYPCTCKSCGRSKDAQEYLEEKLAENRNQNPNKS